MGRDKYVIDGKEYDECNFCRASCPSRKLFKEPDSGLPLKCDMCEGEEEPLCVKWCINDALICEEREEEVEEEEEVKPGDVEIGLGINGGQIWIAEGNGYHGPDVKEGLNLRKGTGKHAGSDERIGAEGYRIGHSL